MRFILVILGLGCLIVAAAMTFGLISIDQTRAGYVQVPKFSADVARVSVGTEKRTVDVPSVSVDKPADQPAPQQSAN